MRNLLLPLAAAFLSSSALASSPSPGLGYDIVEGLTTEVGQRLAGTEAEARARNWAVARLKALGFANVHVEPFDMPVWVRGAETAEVVAPFPQKLVLAALGNSGATPDAGITAEIVGFPSLEALKAAPDAVVKGKIVFVWHRMMAMQDGSSYGTYGPIRFAGPAIASRKGAAAILIRSSAPTITASRIPASPIGWTILPASLALRSRSRPPRSPCPMPSSSNASWRAASR